MSHSAHAVAQSCCTSQSEKSRSGQEEPGRLLRSCAAPGCGVGIPPDGNTAPPHVQPRSNTDSATALEKVQRETARSNRQFIQEETRADSLYQGLARCLP